MKHIYKYTKFFEDGDGGGGADAGGEASGDTGGGNAYADASNVSGMGPVVNAQPGALPSTTGTSGSGDVSFTFKKRKRKKGNPSEVTDLRDLKEVKIKRLNEI